MQHAVDNRRCARLEPSTLSSKLAPGIPCRAQAGRGEAGNGLPQLLGLVRLCLRRSPPAVKGCPLGGVQPVRHCHLQLCKWERESRGMLQ